MKSVLISIRPDWIQKIFRGEKTIEVRKTRPKIEPPFKCFIYETMGETAIPWMDEDGHMVFKGRGEIVAEFICDRIFNFTTTACKDGADISEEEITAQSCLSVDQISKYEYGCGKYFTYYGVYAWHISDLKVYDKPKPLSDFKRWCEAGKWATLERMKRAPQSWCYVDGGLIG